MSWLAAEDLAAARPEAETGTARRDLRARAASWPLDRIGEGMQRLARESGLSAGASAVLQLPSEVATAGDENFARWIYWAADQLEIDAQLTHATVGDLGDALAAAAPAILTFESDGERRFLALVATRAGQAVLLAPEGGCKRAPLADLRRLLAGPPDARTRRACAALLEGAALTPARRARALETLIADRRKSERFDGILLLTLPASAAFPRQLKRAGAPGQFALLLAATAASFAVEIAAWSVLGATLLSGRLDFGALAGWALLLMTLVPLRLAAQYANAGIAERVGALVKARLMQGGLRLDLDRLRGAGVGFRLAQVMEAQAFETLALGGAISASVSLVELIAAAAVLTAGAAGPALAGLLAVFVLACGVLGSGFAGRLSRWTQLRSGLTHGLVERMTGHRTVLAQARGRRDEARDAADLERYLDASRALDRATTPFLVAIPAVWTFAAMAILLATLLGGAPSLEALAIAMGGVLLGARALGEAATGVSALARARVLWDGVGDLFRAGRAVAPASPFAPLKRNGGRAGPLIDAEGVGFAYPGRPFVLSDLSLTIETGERVLLEGPSGGGKSTLAALLTGLRQPQSGLLLLGGLDRASLGEAWRDFATGAPQFHENHIFSGSLAFNLLLGRGWPAAETEIEEARGLCLELGLGPLLERMPAGLFQIVGETGWRLSHGERSRVFLARALLQDAPLVVFDESFAALDPETLKICVDCVRRRARTALVVAHP